MNQYHRPKECLGMKIASALLLFAAVFLIYQVTAAIIGDQDDWAMKQCEKTQSTETCLHTLYR